MNKNDCMLQCDTLKETSKANRPLKDRWHTNSRLMQGAIQCGNGGVNPSYLLFMSGVNDSRDKNPKN